MRGFFTIGKTMGGSIAIRSVYGGMTRVCLPFRKLLSVLVVLYLSDLWSDMVDANVR